MQKGSTLKVMEEFNIQGKQTSFYKYCPGTFGYTLVEQNIDLFSKTEIVTFEHNLPGLRYTCASGPEAC